MNRWISCGCAFAVVLAWSTHAAAHPRSSHRISLEGDTVVVVSRWQRDGLADRDVRLAHPLPAQIELEGAGTPARDGAGQITALTMAGTASGFVTRAPLAVVRADGRLPVAIPSGSALHCVHIDPSLHFTPNAELGLAPQLGHVAPVGLRDDEGREIRGRLVDECPLGSLFLRGTDVQRAEGLRGSTSSTEARQVRTVTLLGFGFVFVALISWLLHRRFARQVELERAEAILEAEFAELES